MLVLRYVQIQEAPGSYTTGAFVYINQKTLIKKSFIFQIDSRQIKKTKDPNIPS